VHRDLDHAFYVLEGEVEFQAGDSTVRADVGTFVFVPRGVGHRFGNPGDVPARMLEVDAPGGFERYYQELAATFPAGTGVDPAVVSAIQRKYDTYPPE
jgi:mannose-6-phosphate isomerase-like protein (cupin superfamily)